MRRKILKIAFVLIMFVCVFIGCKRMPLYHLYTKVLVELFIDIHSGIELDMVVDTQLNEELSNKVNGISPTLVEAIFYDVKSNNSSVTNFLGPNGGEVDVQAGTHHLMIYSYGTESTQTENLNNMLKARAFTSDITQLKGPQFKTILAEATEYPMAKSSTTEYENDPIIYEPDHLYVANNINEQIPAFTGLDTIHVIKAFASTILDLYSLEVLGVKGCENISKAEVFLTGQSKSYFIGKAEMDSSPATLYMTLEGDSKNNRLYTVFCTFGKLPDKLNKVYLDITTTGGDKHRLVYDITDQFEDPKNIHHRLVIEVDVVIPPPEGGGGGLDPEVDEWEDEIIDIPLT